MFTKSLRFLVHDAAAGAASLVKLGSNAAGGGGTCTLGAGFCRAAGGAGFFGPYFFHKIQAATNTAAIRTYFLFFVKNSSTEAIKPLDGVAPGVVTAADVGV